MSSKLSFSGFTRFFIISLFISCSAQLWMFDAVTLDLTSKDGTIKISNFAGIDTFPNEGATGSISVFRADPFLGLANDATADGTVVIFEGFSTDDSHTWQRSADGAGGCSGSYFTITNKASGTLLTKISDTGNLLICAASSTETDCTSTTVSTTGECHQTIHNLSTYVRLQNIF